jgi:lysophospholipase L1-like esterase
MAKISGILKAPGGEILPGITITFVRLSRSFDESEPQTYTVITSDKGEYSIVLPVARYRVSTVNNGATYALGDFAVTEDSGSGSLDDYLFPDESDDSEGGSTVTPALRQAPQLSVIPVMDNPPQVTLTKGAGIVSVAIVSGGTGYAVGDQIVVEGGTTSFPGVIRVTGVGSGGVITAAVSRTPGVYVTNPTNPVSVSGGGGSNARFNVTMNGGVGSSIYAGTQFNRTDETAFLYTGYSPKDISSGYRGNGVQNGTQMVIEFMSDSPQIDIRLVGVNTACDLYVNSQRVSSEPVKTDTSGGAYIYTVDWGGESAIRHYELRGVNTAFGGVIVALNYAVWAPDGYRRPLALIIGDSYTFGTGASQGSYNDSKVMCDALGFDALADGIGGSGWTSVQEGRVPEQRIETKLSAITRQPDYVFFSLGYNDAAIGRLDVIKTQFSASVAKVKELCPQAKIICIGPATPQGATDQISAVRATEIELCDTFSIPFIDVDDWINSKNCALYTGADNVHPNDAGHAYRGIRLAQAVSAIL